MPGHSIAVVRALKSGLWAMAGGKAGLKAIPGRCPQAYPLSEFGVLYTPDVLVGRHPNHNNALLLGNPTSFGIPRSSSFILEHALMSHRDSLISRYFWAGLTGVQCSSVPKKPQGVFARRSFWTSPKKLGQPDSAPCRRWARDKGIREIRTFFWQEGKRAEAEAEAVLGFWVAVSGHAQRD